MNHGRTWLIACLVLLSSAVPAVAQVSEPDAQIQEFTYAGDGDVQISNARLHLWQSESHEFAVTVSTDSGVEGEVCLSTAPAPGASERSLACEPTSIPSNGSETVTVAVDEWPANLTGTQEVHATVKPSGSSDAIARDSTSLTVIRADGDLDEDGLANEREVSLGTGLRTADTDADGLADGEEVHTYETSPASNDSDGDGLSDLAEIRDHQTNPTQSDTDDDGLADSRELTENTNPNVPDTDGDGLDDAREVNTYGTDPTDADTDSDGLDDGVEIETHETSPLKPDTDDDGLEDSLEVNTYGTDPNSVDSDDDGLEDGEEVNEYRTDPASADSDEDGLSDGSEVNRYETNPTNPDTDGDGLEDGAEVNRHDTDPNAADSDNDGQSDRVEVSAGVSVYSVLPGIVLGGTLILLIAGALLYRSDRRLGDVRARVLEAARGRTASDSDVDATPPEEPDRPAADVPPEFLSNEDRVLQLLEDNGGRMRQTDVVDETDWSKSKVSRVLAEMEEDGQVVKVDVGKGNVVTRPEDLPDGARSPFE